MWFTWIGNLLITVIVTYFKKFSFSKFSFFVIIPMYVFYITLIFTSWSLFLAATIKIVNSVFDVLNLVNNVNNSSSGEPIFACFFYLLNALGVAEGLKTGVALLVSDLLAIVTLKGADAFRITSKELIVVTKGIFDK
jgi:hypothetical protein